MGGGHGRDGRLGIHLPDTAEALEAQAWGQEDGLQEAQGPYKENWLALKFQVYKGGCGSSLQNSVTQLRGAEWEVP